MIKDKLWLSICNKKDVLCISCIEDRLKRKINQKDLKYNEKWRGKLGVNIRFAEIRNLKY